MSDKITAIENSDLFTDLSLDEEESLCGGGFFGDAWKKVKNRIKKSWPAILTAGAIAGLSLLTGGKPTGGSKPVPWGGGKWEY
ncbi:hypothetical protein LC612_29120 [Nostoc sp. CHAB 5834]|nr:hypothetical protein [Nostoc sp. CHAB 5834]